MIKIIFLCFLVTCFLGPKFCFALENTNGNFSEKPKNILIVIGYADELQENNTKLLFSHIHHTQIAYETEASIERFLINFKFEKQGSDFVFKNTVVKVLNSNILCPNENVDHFQTKRTVVCKEQLERSENVKKYLELHLNKFDSLYYIGHARMGHGLGVGPFIPDYIFPLKFYNIVELGKIKNITLASCDSNEYYNSDFFENNKVQFKGISGKKLWMQDQLPFLINELYSLFIEDFQKYMEQLNSN